MLRRLVSYSCIYEACMSPALNGSSAIRRFERSDAIEIHDGITFDFYTGLPHMYYFQRANSERTIKRQLYSKPFERSSFGYLIGIKSA